MCPENGRRAAGGEAQEESTAPAARLPGWGVGELRLNRGAVPDALVVQQLARITRLVSCGSSPAIRGIYHPKCLSNQSAIKARSLDKFGQPCPSPITSP